MRSVRVITIWLLVISIVLALMLGISVFCAASALEAERTHALVAVAFAGAALVVLVKVVPQYAQLWWDIAKSMAEAVKTRRW
jgi:hypothetical protein